MVVVVVVLGCARPVGLCGLGGWVGKGPGRGPGCREGTVCALVQLHEVFCHFLCYCTVGAWPVA